MDDYDTFTHSWAEDEDLIIDESNPELVPIPQNEIDEIAKSINEKTSNLQRELLTYHYKLKHLPFSAFYFRLLSTSNFLDSHKKRAVFT
jgi:hypothetical protein